ncbi:MULTISPECIES: hypothetical protein [unclassified Carboxylicivirga]|uniref:hypothetical protein n=1 Tax=Carboxylicivirga TaxID=1628153 RepID=UPI003D33018A
MRGILLLTLFLITLLSCDKEQDGEVTKLNDLFLVTGMHVVDAYGHVMQIYGNPNDSNRESTVDNEGVIGGSNYSYAFYPNPVSDILTIQTPVEKIESLWVVKGKVSSNYRNIDFTDYFTTETLDTVDIDRNSVVKLKDINATRVLNINLSEEVEDGFYKVIFKTESSVHWFSIIKTGEDIETVEQKYFPW